MPGEAAGLISDPAFKKARHDGNPEAFPFGEWFTGDNVNLAIGQGDVGVTPLQLANAYATFANGGTRYAPNLGLEIRRPGGGVLRAVAPRVAAQVALPPQVRDPILQGLLGATTDSRGTATGAFLGFPLDQYPVAGKTGTAQASGKKQDTALFAAIAPANDPRYAVAVVMEQAGFGATSAAPVARRVLGQLSGVEQGPVQLVSGGRG